MMRAVLLLVPEADAGRALGVEVALVDHDALCRSGAVAAGAEEGPCDGSLRPTMPSTGVGCWTAAATRPSVALAARGVHLRTSPAADRSAHELPGWYDLFRVHTPRTTWTTGPSLDQPAAGLASLGAPAAVLRDYVKSAKHDGHEAAYIPDTGDGDHVAKVARRLLELRGDDSAGGLLARAYEDLTGAETRTWWVGGECRLVTAHPDTPEAEPGPVDPGPYAAGVVALGTPFVTLDLARRTDGTWRLVEIGDGQVSDRPRTTPSAALLPRRPH
jgi:hypothetical protein